MGVLPPGKTPQADFAASSSTRPPPGVSSSGGVLSVAAAPPSGGRLEKFLGSIFVFYLAEKHDRYDDRRLPE